MAEGSQSKRGKIDTEAMELSFLEIINDFSKKEAETGDFLVQQANIKKTIVEENPRLIAVKFYEGASKPDKDYSVKSYGSRAYGSSKTLQEILEDLPPGQLMFTGPPGSGKTTLMRRITRDVLEEKIEKMKIIKLVIFINCKIYRGDLATTLHEFLFRNISAQKFTDERRNRALAWININQDNVLLVMDGLDTLPYSLENVDESCNMVRDTPAKFFRGILTRKIFPRSHVIASSREFKIASYEGSLRADKVIALVGLSEKSIENLILSYMGEKNGKIILDYLEKTPALYSLCTIPVFLSFTLISLNDFVQAGMSLLDQEGVPNTMSGIMVLLLQHFECSPHARQENLADIIDKLKPLSFEATTKQVVVFEQDSFDKMGLDSTTVHDIVIKLPAPPQLPSKTTKVLIGDYIYFFCHQSIQETLAALHIVEMPLRDFEEFLPRIHCPHFGMVRRIACGILLDTNVRPSAHRLISRGQHLEDKSNLLKQSLQQELLKEVRSKNERAQRLELLISLREASEGVRDILEENLNSVDISYVDISVSDMYAIGTLLRFSKRVTKLKLAACAITSAVLQAVERSSRGSEIQIGDLDLSENPDMGYDGMKHLAQFISNCKVNSLIMNNCEIKSEHLKHLSIALKETDAKISTLDLNNNQVLGEEGMLAAAEIMKHCHVSSLFLINCGLTVKELQEFYTAIESYEFDISNNRDIAPDAMAYAVEIVRRCKVKSFHVRNCTLTMDKVKAMMKELKNAKIEELDVSDNPGMETDVLRHICQIIRQCQVEVLKAYNCDFELSHLQEISKGLAGYKVKSLDLRGFSCSNEEAISGVSSLLDCAQERIEVELDSLAKEEMREFQEKIVDTQCTANVVVWIGGDKIEFRQGSKVEIIGPEGGAITVDGCQVIFPPGAVSVSVQFCISLSINFDLYRDGCVVACPVISCLPSMTFLKPVKIVLPTWYSTVHDDVTVSVMKKDHVGAGEMVSWDKFCQVALKPSSNTIDFETGDFSLFTAFIEWLFHPRVTLGLSVSLHFSRDGNFSIVFCHAEVVAMRVCKQQLVERNFIPVSVNLDPIDAVCGSELQVFLKSSEDDYMFDPDIVQNLHVDKSLACQLFKSISYRLANIPEPKSLLKLECRIGGRRVPFNLRWPSSEDLPTQYNIIDSRVNITQNLIA